MIRASLPKVELHLHVEGAAPPELIRTLAAEQSVDVSRAFDADGDYAWTDFGSFLRTYELASSVLRRPEDYRRLMEAVLARSAGDGVIYTELFLASDLCGDGSPRAWAEYLDAMIEGADAARAASGIEARFIQTAIRHFGPERAEAAARLGAATAGRMLTGFGMGGDERFAHPGDFARAFAIAGEAGLGLTVHAGEVAGPESVRSALDALPVTRVGHGVRAAEDADLVRRLAAEGIVLEVCPGSNVALGVYPDLAAHPVARLRAAGVPVTVSTDDPPYFRTDMVSEYASLSRAFGWTETDFRDMNLAAAGAAFCDEATRAAIVARLNEEAP